MDYAHSIAHMPRSAAAATPEEYRRTDQTAWTKLTEFRPSLRRLRQQRIVACTPSDPASVAFDILRTKVLRQLGQNNWKTVAITSPTPGCGKSVVALNLAFSLARAGGGRTAILELDLHRPSMRNILGLEAPLAVDKFLRGTALVGEAFARWEDTLAIAAADIAMADSVELIHKPSVKGAISRVREILQPDVILFDMPPLFVNGDVLAFAKNVDCAIIVAAAGTTTLPQLERCEHELAQETNILGVVLNKCRYRPREVGY